MGLVDLTSVVVKEQGPDYEKFDVEKNDKARIHLPSGKIIQEHVHVFHREEPTMIERNGRKVPEWSRESFAGTFICLGDFETVLANPSYGDPEACPACAAMNSGVRLVERPKRTFALNVVKYATNRRSHDLRNNNLEVQVWRHADIRKIEPILQAARQKSLTELDFLIEADNSDWKKYQIQPALGEVAFRGNDEIKANMKNAYASQFDEKVLTEACGRKLSVDSLQSEITRLKSEYRLELEQAAASDDIYASDTTETSELSQGGTVDITQTTSEDDMTVVPLGDLATIDSHLFD